jgi:hypothetical protein
MFAIPFWLKIVGPVVAIALLIGGVMAWGHSKYNAGHKAGVEETDAAYKAASDKLKADAAVSATKADDKAVARLEDYQAQAKDDQAAVDKAKEEGRSPLDALFGN